MSTASERDQESERDAQHTTNGYEERAHICPHIAFGYQVVVSRLHPIQQTAWSTASDDANSPDQPATTWRSWQSGRNTDFLNILSYLSPRSPSFHYLAILASNRMPGGLVIIQL